MIPELFTSLRLRDLELRVGLAPVDESHIQRRVLRPGVGDERDDLFEARQLEQVFDEAVQALGVALDDADELLRGVGPLRRAHQEGLARRADRRHGRAQLVGDVGHELAAHVLETSQLGHVGEHLQAPHALELLEKAAPLRARFNVHANLLKEPSTAARIANHPGHAELQKLGIRKRRTISLMRRRGQRTAQRCEK